MRVGSQISMSFIKLIQQVSMAPTMPWRTTTAPANQIFCESAPSDEVNERSGHCKHEDASQVRVE